MPAAPAYVLLASEITQGLPSENAEILDHSPLGTAAAAVDG